MKKKKSFAIMFVLIAISQLASCQNPSNKTNSETNTITTKTSNSRANNKVINNKNNEMKTIQLTKADFLKNVADYENNPQAWKYLGDKPALIDFYADWCGPCKMIAPMLEELAKEYEGKIYIYKINTEKEQELAAAFEIQSIPSLLFIPMGETPQMARGALPKEELKRIIDEILLKSK